MVSAKKTSIKIHDGDAPKIKPKTVNSPAKNISKKIESIPQTDMKQEMRKKLANTIAENRIDLTQEGEIGQKNEKKDNTKAKIDLRDPEKIRTFDDVADRMREKISNAIGKSIPIKDAEKEQLAPEVAVPEVEIPSASQATEDNKDAESGPLEMPEAILAPDQTVQKPKSSPSLYRNIAGFFLFCTFVLVAVILYFYGTKMTIVITPKQERVSDNLLIEVSDSSRGVASNTSSIIGVVDTITIEQSKEYPTSGTQVIGDDAVGMVTIYNNYIKNQPLVATTRLLAADGTLFRTRDTVMVPAGGSVEVKIYADKAGPEINVAPTKFTIPGLWAGIQDKIYAESKETIKFSQQVEKALQQADIESAAKDLKETLTAEAKKQLKDKYKEYGQLLYAVDEASITQSTDSKVSDKIEKFVLKIKADVLVVAFNDTNIVKMAREKLVTNLPPEKELAQFNDKQIVFKLDNYDIKEKIANVNASFEGITTLAKNANIIDKTKIDGLNAGQVSSYVASLSGVDSYQIKYYPSWFKVVPKMPDRISIQIK